MEEEEDAPPCKFLMRDASLKAFEKASACIQKKGLWSDAVASYDNDYFVGFFAKGKILWNSRNGPYMEK